MSWKTKTAMDYFEDNREKYEFVRKQVSFFLLKNVRTPGFSRSWIDGDVLVELYGAKFNDTDLLLEELTHRSESRYRVWAHYPPKENSDCGLADKLVDIVEELERQYAKNNQQIGGATAQNDISKPCPEKGGS